MGLFQFGLLLCVFAVIANAQFLSLKGLSCGGGFPFRSNQNMPRFPSSPFPFPSKSSITGGGCGFNNFNNPSTRPFFGCGTTGIVQPNIKCSAFTSEPACQTSTPSSQISLSCPAPETTPEPPKEPTPEPEPEPEPVSPPEEPAAAPKPTPSPPPPEAPAPQPSPPCSNLASPCSNLAYSCPNMASRCSILGSPRPNIASPCPDVESPCPSIASPYPNVASPCPSTASPCSNIACPCPNIASLCPNMASPCPNIASPCPNPPLPCPNLASPCPTPTSSYQCQPIQNSSPSSNSCPGIKISGNLIPQYNCAKQINQIPSSTCTCSSST